MPNWLICMNAVSKLSVCFWPIIFDSHLLEHMNTVNIALVCTKHWLPGLFAIELEHMDSIVRECGYLMR